MKRASPDRRRFIAGAAALAAGGAASAAPGTRKASVVDARDHGVAGNGRADDSSALQRACNAATGGRLLVPAGTYRFDAVLRVPERTQLELAPGATLECHVRGGGPAITLANGSRLWGSGPASRIVAAAGSEISTVVTNAAHDGTQEYCYVEGLTLVANAGARIAGALVELVAVFVNSSVRDCILDANQTAPAALRIAGGVKSGFGPIVVDNVWAAHAAGHNIVITEESPHGGSATCWLTNVTSENQAAGHAALYVRGTGGISSVLVRNFHYEHGTPAAAATPAVLLDGAPGFTLDGADLLAQPIANKAGIVITDNALNYRTRLVDIQNVNGIDPIVDDRRYARRLGARNVAHYETADPGDTSGHSDHVVAHLVQMPGGVATRVISGPPSDALDAPEGTLIVDRAGSRLYVRVGGRWRSTTLG